MAIHEDAAHDLAHEVFQEVHLMLRRLNRVRNALQDLGKNKSRRESIRKLLDAQKFDARIDERVRAMNDVDRTAQFDPAYQDQRDVRSIDEIRQAKELTEQEFAQLMGENEELQRALEQYEQVSQELEAADADLKKAQEEAKALDVNNDGIDDRDVDDLNGPSGPVEAAEDAELLDEQVAEDVDAAQQEDARARAAKEQEDAQREAAERKADGPESAPTSDVGTGALAAEAAVEAAGDVEEAAESNAQGADDPAAEAQETNAPAADVQAANAQAADAQGADVQGADVQQAGAESEVADPSVGQQPGLDPAAQSQELPATEVAQQSDLAAQQQPGLTEPAAVDASAQEQPGQQANGQQVEPRDLDTAAPAQEIPGQNGQDQNGQAQDGQGQDGQGQDGLGQTGPEVDEADLSQQDPGSDTERQAEQGEAGATPALPTSGDRRAANEAARTSQEQDGQSAVHGAQVPVALAEDPAIAAVRKENGSQQSGPPKEIPEGEKGHLDHQTRGGVVKFAAVTKPEVTPVAGRGGATPGQQHAAQKGSGQKQHSPELGKG